MSDISYVRTEMTAASVPPNRTSGPGVWLRKNLFATPTDTVLTLIGILFLAWVIPPLYGFLIGRAVPVGGTVEQCRVENVGRLLGLYRQRDRVLHLRLLSDGRILARQHRFRAAGSAGTSRWLMPKAPYKRINAVLFFIVFPIVSVNPAGKAASSACAMSPPSSGAG